MRVKLAALILTAAALAGCQRSAGDAAAAREAADDARAEAKGASQADQAVKDARIDALEARVDALEKQVILLGSSASRAALTAPPTPPLNLPDTSDDAGPRGGKGTARGDAGSQPAAGPGRHAPSLPSDEEYEEP